MYILRLVEKFISSANIHRKIICDACLYIFSYPCVLYIRVFYLFINKLMEGIIISSTYPRVRVDCYFAKMFNARKNPHQIIILLHETSKIPRYIFRVCVCVCRLKFFETEVFPQMCLGVCLHICTFLTLLKLKEERKWNGYFICAINILLNRVFPFSLLLVFYFDQLFFCIY